MLLRAASGSRELCSPQGWGLTSLGAGDEQPSFPHAAGMAHTAHITWWCEHVVPMLGAAGLHLGRCQAVLGVSAELLAHLLNGLVVRVDRHIFAQATCIFGFWLQARCRERHCPSLKDPPG